MSKITRETKKAVNTDAKRPISSVTANPLIGPVPNWKRKSAEMIVVMWVSMIVPKARPKPFSMAGQRKRGMEERHHPEQDDEVQQQGQHGIDAGAAVVKQHRQNQCQEADERRQHALADRVAPEGRTDGPLFERRHRGGQRAAAQHEREVGGLLVRERAFDDALIFDLRLDVRSRHDLVVEDDGDASADVGAGEVAELARAVRREREGDVGLTELALRDVGGLQVRARDRDGLAYGVVLGARGAPDLVLLGAGEDVDFALQVLGNGGQRRFGSGGRAAFDQAELELRGGLDDVLDAGRVVHAGELDDDTVAALRRDDRLRYPQGVPPGG